MEASELGRDSNLTPVMKELLHQAIEQLPHNQNQRKVHLLMLVATSQEVEESSQGMQLCNNQEDENVKSRMSRAQMDTILGYLTDMQGSLRLISRDMERETTRMLARKCLVDSLVMRYQLHLILGSGENEVLESLHNIVRERDSDEEKESFKFCRDLKPVSGKYRPISKFIALMKELISAIHSCYEIPQLVQFAMNAMEDGKVLLENLLQDRRPSRRSDVEKYLSNIDLTDSRKEELNRLVNETSSAVSAPVEVEEEEEEAPNSTSFNAKPGPSRSPSAQQGSNYMSTLQGKMRGFSSHTCLSKLRQLDVRMNKLKKSNGPPSHRGVRLGAWLPEEETMFIEETLRCGVGNWAQIKSNLNTIRSSQQLKDKWRNVKSRDVKDVAVRLGIKYR